jgi:FkbM family methyltransferase
MHACLFRTVNRLGAYPLARSARIWLDHHTPWGIRRRRRLLAFYAQFMGEGDLCFDIGANIGDRAELFLRLGARVVCVEPIAECAAALGRRFAATDRLEVIAKAVGEREGVAQFRICESNPQLSSLSDAWTQRGRHAGEYDWAKGVFVDMTTLDRLIYTHGTPAFCKIDVEGAEEGVLRGLTQSIPCLSFEFHGELLDETLKCLERIGAIAPASYNCTLCDAPGMLFTRWIGSSALYRHLVALDRPSLWGDIYVRFDSLDEGDGAQ